MGTMFDTIGDPAATFHGLTVDQVAAYGNGRYANYSKAKEEFPHAHVLEIDVSGQGIGNAGDFEQFDMAYSEAGSWAKRRIEAGIHRPVIYFSVGNSNGVLESLKAAGVAREHVRIWTAHYTGEPHLCSQHCGFPGTADATQWATSGPPSSLPHEYAGRNIDISMTADNFH